MLTTVNMVVDAAKIAEMENLLASPTKENLGRGEILFDREVIFPDGHSMVIEVIASENPKEESAWCQGVLFDKFGNELGCTDVGESFAGEFQVGDWGVMYICNVVPA